MKTEKLGFAGRLGKAFVHSKLTPGLFCRVFFWASWPFI